MMFNRLPEKSFNFRKFENYKTCPILMSRASVVLKVLLSESWVLLRSAAKGWNSLGYWHMNFGPLNFANVTVMSMGKYHLLL